MTGTSKFDVVAAEAERRKKEGPPVMLEESDRIEERPGKRQPGRRSDPRYTQVTAYIPKTLHMEVKRALLDGEVEKEFSLLVEELLDDWMRQRESLEKSA